MDPAVIGIGCDIETTDRFEALDRERDKSFLKKIFTPPEIEYCYAGKTPQRLSSHFCAKEAVIKALAGYRDIRLSHREIEVMRFRNGKPYIRLHNKQLDGIEIHLSLSHSRGCAMAVALAVQGRSSEVSN